MVPPLFAEQDSIKNKKRYYRGIDYIMENQNEKAFAISDSLDKEIRFDFLKLYYEVTYVQYIEGDTTITEIDKKMLENMLICAWKRSYMIKQEKCTVFLVIKKGKKVFKKDYTIH